MTDSHTAPAIPGQAARLASWGLIRVSGADAQAFLHGQLSNDLLALSPDAARWAAYCSPKGRMLAGFLVWTDGPETVWLACDRALVPGLIKRLRMFVLRAKAVLDDLSASHRVLGVTGGDAPLPLQVRRDGGAVRIGLPPVDGVARCLFIEAAGDDAADGGEGRDESAWQLAMIRAGEVWIGVATQDQFVPQMVNFDAIGGINFRKGCYPGQEIVARAHYRGAVKRRMRRATVAMPAAPGQPLFAAGGQECGTVANAVATATGSEILAVVPIDAAGDGAIRLGAPDGPGLAFTDLPYPIPAAA